MDVPSFLNSACGEPGIHLRPYLHHGALPVVGGLRPHRLGPPLTPHKDTLLLSLRKEIPFRTSDGVPIYLTFHLFIT